MNIEADPRRRSARARPLVVIAPTRAWGRYALMRVLILAGVGAGTCLGYAALFARLAGLDLGWILLVTAGSFGLLVGGACGLLLGSRRRDDAETDPRADR